MQQISDCEVNDAKENRQVNLPEEPVAEYWDLCDEHGVNLGEQIVRGQPHRPGTYHIVVCVWIWNTKGQVLTTLRSKKKKQFPGLWEGLGGSAQAGETSLESVVREVKEEIGLDYPPEQFTLLKRSLEKTALVDIYELKADFDLADLKLQEEEVDEARWTTAEELQQIISAGQFSAAALRRWQAVYQERKNY